jgi:RNA polymerase sigma-70 factor (ECF subfamily)
MIPSRNELAIDWSAAIARHDRRVVVALLGRGVPIERAKEIAQETWARLMQKHAAGELLEVKLPGLAITQALFLARDEARRDLRRPSAELPESLGDGRQSAEAQLLTHEQVQVALLALQRLPENARRVFELAYDEPALTHREIAARVGLSEQRVKQIVCEVRKSLREVLS